MPAHADRRERLPGSGRGLGVHASRPTRARKAGCWRGPTPDLPRPGVHARLQAGADDPSSVICSKVWHEDRTALLSSGGSCPTFGRCTACRSGVMTRARAEEQVCRGSIPQFPTGGPGRRKYGVRPARAADLLAEWHMNLVSIQRAQSIGLEDEVVHRGGADAAAFARRPPADRDALRPRLGRDHGRPANRRSRPEHAGHHARPAAHSVVEAVTASSPARRTSATTSGRAGRMQAAASGPTCQSWRRG